jgi:adenylate cyclase
MMRGFMTMSAIRRRRIKSTLAFTGLGAVTGCLIGVAATAFDDTALVWSVVRGGSIGVAIGFVFGVGEEFAVPRLSRRLSFGLLNLTRVGTYTAVILLALIVVNAISVALVLEVGLASAAAVYITEGNSTRDLIVAVLAAISLTSALQVRRLHNRGEIRHLLTGKYYYPQEESRVFLFADLVASTAHAERLGPLKYSLLLRDLFTDVSEAILAWHGEVYQYAGDEVIISWRAESGVRNAACVMCFMEMMASLEERGDTYRQRYDCTPELRGAIHGGPVVTAWVGEAKKELAFHGDALNATARILSECKDREARLLASEEVLDRLTLPGTLVAEAVGEVELRGKREPVRLCVVQVAPADTND